MPGVTKLAVPTCTAVAPASKNSTTSVALMMPPMPISGTFTARATCHTMRKATGLMAGPDNPPVTLASTGRRVFTSIAIPTNVLMSESASAPASTQALAMATTSVTLGESLTIRGLLVAARQAGPDLLVAELEARALARLELPRIVTRVVPMLGLVATMIPLGPALRALGAGDLGAMGRDLALAFSAVILALLASAITYVVAHVRRRWYAEELLMVEKGDLAQGDPARERAP